jgi:hypothetical protein
MKSVLLNYATHCSARDLFKGVIYDRERNMSVVFDGMNYVPFIDADSANLSLASKTFTNRETDDVLPSPIVFGTKTRAECERDDQCPFDY